MASCPSSKCSSCKESKDSSACGSCSSGGVPGVDPFAEQDKQISGALSRIKHKLFIMSGKGGVGKSSVTVNTAAALAAKGYKVGILDVDIHGPSVPGLLGIRSKGMEGSEEGGIDPVQFSDNLSIVSMDSLLQDKDTAVLWRGPKKTAAIRQFVADINWGDLDFLLIDSPPGTGDEHMTVLKTIPDALCVVVTTPQEVSLADVRKALNFLQVANGRVLGIVENMSGLACPHCGGEIDLFKKGGGRELAERRGLRFLGAIPLDLVTVVSADRGVPVVLLEEDSQAKKSFLELADNIVKAVQEDS